MIVHFICRGNVFRSLIAESYLNSLEFEELTALSSGTVAASHKEQNLANHRLTRELLEDHGILGFAKDGYGDQLTQARVDQSDVVVCLNQRVHDDCLHCVTFSARPLVWSVADIGEPGRIPETKSDVWRYQEAAYQEIAGNVDRLVSDLLVTGPRRCRPEGPGSRRS